MRFGRTVVGQLGTGQPRHKHYVLRFDIVVMNHYGRSAMQLLQTSGSIQDKPDTLNEREILPLFRSFQQRLQISPTYPFVQHSLWLLAEPYHANQVIVDTKTVAAVLHGC